MYTVHICSWWIVNIYDLVFPLYAFHLTITYQYHLLSLLCCCFHLLFFANINHFIHAPKKCNKSFWQCNCLIIFDYFPLTFCFKLTHISYKLVIFLEFTLFNLIFSCFLAELCSLAFFTFSFILSYFCFYALFLLFMLFLFVSWYT